MQLGLTRDRIQYQAKDHGWMLKALGARVLGKPGIYTTQIVTVIAKGRHVYNERVWLVITQVKPHSEHLTLPSLMRLTGVLV